MRNSNKFRNDKVTIFILHVTITNSPTKSCPLCKEKFLFLSENTSRYLTVCGVIPREVALLVNSKCQNYIFSTNNNILFSAKMTYSVLFVLKKYKLLVLALSFIIEFNHFLFPT